MAQFTVALEKIINTIHLEVVYTPQPTSEIMVGTLDVNRPGLLLAGFDAYFDPTRIQILGLAEFAYLNNLTKSKRKLQLDFLFSANPIAVVVSRNLEVDSVLLSAAKKSKTPLLRSKENTSELSSSIISVLAVELAPRITRHGVLVEVYGEGILMLGDSGVGKSETAIELVKRGHRLIADDAVELRRVSNRTIVGRSPENIRHFVEMRGVGIINVARVFGFGAVKETEKIDLVAELETWEQGKHYSQTGIESQYIDILGISIPSCLIPIRPGRNLAVILEAAAINNRQKKMGYNAARELFANMGIEE